MKRTTLHRTLFLRFLLPMVVLAFLCAVTAGAGNDRHLTQIDSLNRYVATHSAPRDLLPALARLSAFHVQTPAEVPLLKQRFSLALSIDSIPAVYTALDELVRYYYNLGMHDSLTFWAQKIDSIARERNEYPDVLFDARGRSCQDLMWGGNFEMAMNDAMQLYELANSTGSTYGLVRASEALGQIYQAMRRDSSAVASFGEGLRLLESIGGNLDTQIRLTSYQVESALRTDQWEQADSILARYRHYISLQDERNRKYDELYDTGREYLLFYSFRTEFYLKKEQLDKARRTLNLAKPYLDDLLTADDYAGRIYLAVKAHYYKQAGDNLRALEVLDKLLEQEQVLEDMQLKAQILEELDRKKEALEVYDAIHEYITARNDETFLRQMTQLQLLHEQHSREMQQRELNATARRMQQKQRQLLLLIFLASLLLVAIYVLYIYYRKVYRLNRELESDKNLLLHSRLKLIEATEKADQASRMKSAFLANMSHEIRTPMNAIVGFSELLAEPGITSEEKKEFASVIRNNTDLMLNLLNDVLDLTRMETGDMQFKLVPSSLADCCCRALDSIRRHVPDGVELTFTPGLDDIELHTDPLRLQQLLINLLSNSVKFTERGEINLSFTSEADGRQIRIVVTDTGCGIPAGKQKDIFRRFERLDDYKPGVGLGLSICALLAERLGGTIFVDPGYTSGARLVFIHPAGTAD